MYFLSVTSRVESSAVPPFVALAGNPLRWRVLLELARSDRLVGELTDLIAQPQALVSYHLGRLRAGGLVSSRQSSFDGRAAFYRIHLDRCGALLAAAGTALHPGLATSERVATGPFHSVTQPRARVLFVCTGNGSRSQIAEALLRTEAGDAVDVASAGSHPKPIHRNTIKVLAERGIDISAAQPKPLAQFEGQQFDFVITLCDRVREVCPQFPGDALAMHWSTADPSRVAGSARATLPTFRFIADELESRIRYLLPLIHQRCISTPSKETARHDR